MTDREVKKLRRADLLDMMLSLTKENDELRRQLEEARQQLADRSIAISNSGSLAEAALQLSGVFEAAQDACEQYMHNIRQRSEHIEAYCRRMEQETQEKCDRMLEEAKRQADAYWHQTVQLSDSLMTMLEEETTP